MVCNEPQTFVACVQAGASIALVAVTGGLVWATRNLAHSTDEMADAARTETEWRLPTWEIGDPSAQPSNQDFNDEGEPILSPAIAEVVLINQGLWDGLLEEVKIVRFPNPEDGSIEEIRNQPSLGGEAEIEMESGEEYEDIRKAVFPRAEPGTVRVSHPLIPFDNAQEYVLLLVTRDGETRLWRFQAGVHDPGHPDLPDEPHPGGPFFEYGLTEIDPPE